MVGKDAWQTQTTSEGLLGTSGCLQRSPSSGTGRVLPSSDSRATTGFSSRLWNTGPALRPHTCAGGGVGICALLARKRFRIMSLKASHGRWNENREQMVSYNRPAVSQTRLLSLKAMTVGLRTALPNYLIL